MSYQSRPDDRLVTPAFAVITTAALAYFTALGVLTPTLPRYVKEVLGGSGTEVGVAVGAFALAAAVLRPLAGRIGDRVGRRVLVIAGSVVVGCSILAYGASHDLAVLVALRLVTGAGEAAVFVGAATAVQDVTPPGRRGQAASYFSISLFAGLAIGTVMGEWVRLHHGYGWVWSIAAAWCGVAVVLARWIPGGVPASASEDDSGGGVPPRFLYPAARRPGLVLFLGVCGFAGFAAFVALYAASLGLASAGGVFATFGVVVIATRVAGGRLPDVLGPVRTTSAALALQAVGLGLMSSWPAVTGLFIATVVFAVGFAFLFPSILAFVVENAADRERSHAVGTVTLFFDAAEGAGAPLLGIVVTYAGERAAFAVAAGLSLCGLVLARSAFE